MAKVFQILGALAIITALSISAGTKRGPVHSPSSKLLVTSTIPSNVFALEASLATVDAPSIEAALPSTRSELKWKSGEWCRIEAALIEGAERPLGELLRRYEAEFDPAYKGLMAVLLSSVPRTHGRILSDQQSAPREGWDLFHGMALLGLVRELPDSVESATAHDRGEWWERLFNFVDVGVIAHEGAVESRVTGEYVKRLACSSSMSHTSEGFRIARECQPTPDAALRAALTNAYLAEWDWDFPYWLSLEVLQKSASEDSELARAFAEAYLGSAEEDTAKKGLWLLESSVLPADVFPLLEKWTRTATDSFVLKQAIEVLGVQNGEASERVLNELYSTRGGDARDEVLKAMAVHGGPSFRSIAETELQSVDRDRRIAGLRILARYSDESSLSVVLQAGAMDPEPKTRHEVLFLLKERDIWGPKEDKHLIHLMTDSDTRVQKFAARLHAAEDRSRVRPEVFGSDWDRPDPGEE